MSSPKLPVSATEPAPTDLVEANTSLAFPSLSGTTNWEMNKYIGELYERVFMEILKDGTNVAYFRFQPTPMYPFWDLIAYTPYFKDDIDESFEEILEAISYEVKCDTRALETGNIAVEVHDGTKDSGLAVTKADRWIQFLHDPKNDYGEYYDLSVDDLKKLCDAAPTIKAGNGKRTTIHLIKMSDIDKACRKRYDHTGLPAGLAEKIKTLKTPAVKP
jgi:hypothetical protein